MWSVFSKGKNPPARRIAFAVATAFALTGAAWVLITDVLLYEVTRDPALVARIETAKGWTFVVLATALLYAVTYWSASRFARAQAGISAVVDSIADGVLLLGPDRTIRRVNAAAARMLRSADLVGMDAAEFSRRFRVSCLDGSRMPPNELISQRAFDEGGPLHYKAILHPPGAPELIISATAAAVRVYAAETPDMVVSVMHDITETEHLSRLRDRFMAAAAHSLKTPVAVIKTNAELLLTSDAAQSDVAATAIRRQCDRIDLLVQNLLVLARIRSGTLELHTHAVELAPLIEQVTGAVAAVSSANEIRNDFDTRPRIYADEERMALVLRNLLDEALRLAAPPARITVLLAESGPDVEIGIRHRCRPSIGHAWGDAGEPDELRVHRLVTDAIIAAHGGDLRHEAEDSEATAWIRLPAIDGRG